MRSGFCALLLCVAVGCSETPEEQYLKGLRYASGENVPQDAAEAARWYRIAADRGHAEAQHKLGYAYHTGEGVARNQAEALKWVRMAAEQGHSASQFNLALELDRTAGSGKVQIEAYAWFRLFLNNPSLKPDEMSAHCRERIAALENSLSEQQLTDARELISQLRRKIRTAKRKQ